MALLFCDSFDHYDDNHFSEKWDGRSYANIGGDGREGQGIDWQNGTFSTITKNVPNSGTLIAGSARYESGLPGGSQRLIRFDNSGTAQAYLEVNANGAVEVHTFPGGTDTVVGTSANGAIRTGAYIFVEFLVTFATGATGSAKVAINGQIVLNLTNVVTAQSGTTANQVTFAGTDGSRSIDDVYICDGLGSTNNSFLGDVRIAVVVPNANGRVDQWTRTGGTTSGNYTAVSEVPPASPAPDDDTSYVASATAGQADTYKLSALGTVGSIKAVQIVASARKDDSGSRVLALGFGNGTTEQYDAGTSLPSSYVMIRRTLDQNPISNASWTAADITSGQLALKVIS